jgi:lysozyme
MTDSKPFLINKTVNTLKKDEGFRSKVYKDHLGNDTFGHGFTYITEHESERILGERVQDLAIRLSHEIPCYNKISDGRKSALINMAYQLGVNGLLGFKRMLKALQAGDYDKAYTEAKNSKWATQTPQRAERVARMLRDGY